ncbi:MAG: hypothetical protein HQL67_04390 [Magnetococcales bacterium]|nr:hypothetical protein [Magnetococcales bacterium]
MDFPNPDLEDYVRLFDRYGEKIQTIYQEEEEDDRYALLFEQIVRLLIKPSPFNRMLPEKFRLSSHRYLRGDPLTVKHFAYPSNRHFMMSDLYDLIMLKGGLALKRQIKGGTCQ